MFRLSKFSIPSFQTNPVSESTPIIFRSLLKLISIKYNTQLPAQVERITLYRSLFDFVRVHFSNVTFGLENNTDAHAKCNTFYSGGKLLSDTTNLIYLIKEREKKKITIV